MLVIARKLYYVRYLKHIIIRQNSRDLSIFRNIFVSKCYKLPINIKPNFIIDAGAHAGYASIYFATKYPNAQIIAIEPESSNFKTLNQNVKHFPNIKPINAGIWSKCGFLRIVDRGTGNWGFKTEEVIDGKASDVKSITINSILQDSGFDKIDILKLDVEGTEKELFLTDYESWLHKVNIIIIELHDDIYEGITDTFYSAVDIDKWKQYKNWENVILIRKKFLNC